MSARSRSARDRRTRSRRRVSKPRAAGRVTQVRALAAAAAVLALATGCRATEWPSDADRSEFCDVVTGLHFTEGGYDDALERLGTPEDLPFEARRYLLHHAGNGESDPVGDKALDAYVADHC